MADDADFFHREDQPRQQGRISGRRGQWVPFKKSQADRQGQGFRGTPWRWSLSITRNGLLINGLRRPRSRLEPGPPGHALGGSGSHRRHADFLRGGQGPLLGGVQGRRSVISPAPGQNFIYADVEGNIGWIAGVRIPQRGEAVTTPPCPQRAPAASQRLGRLSAFRGPAQLCYNPPEGFIVTANNKSVGDEYPHYISTYWAGPERASRIRELIAGQGETFGRGTSRTIQADNLFQGGRNDAAISFGGL